MIGLIYQPLNVPEWIKDAPEHLKTKEMCNKAVEKWVCLLKYVPDYFKTQEMCNKAGFMEPLLLKYVSAQLKAQKYVKKPLKKGFRGFIMSLII